MKREQRREIYEKILWCIGDCNKEGVCVLLDCVYPNTSTAIAFPEFVSLMPRYFSGLFWWEFNESGNAKRRIALEKAIALTY